MKREELVVLAMKIRNAEGESEEKINGNIDLFLKNVPAQIAQGVSRKDKTVGLIPCCIRDDSRSIPNAFQKEFVNHSLMLERQRFGIERKRKGGIKPSGKCKEAE